MSACRLVVSRECEARSSLSITLPYNAPSLSAGPFVFQNPDIPLAELPRADRVEWSSLHPRYARQLQVKRTLILLLAGVGGTLVHLFPKLEFLPPLILWPALLMYGIPFVGWPLISVPRRGYAIRDKDIVYRSGVFWRQITAVPFNRIQHVETSSTPLDRHFGTSVLQLYTAGGAGGDLKIHGLPRDTAERLRAYILDMAGATIERV